MPLEEQGVLVTPGLFEKGIWWHAGGKGNSYLPDEIMVSETYRRSGNQAEYVAALTALMNLSFGSDKRYMAVVSICWDTGNYIFVLPKRAWLTIYHNSNPIVSYSEKDGHGFRHFLEAWDTPETDQNIWAQRFRSDVFDYWKSVREEGERLGKEAKRGQALVSQADQAISAFV